MVVEELIERAERTQAGFLRTIRQLVNQSLTTSGSLRRERTLKDLRVSVTRRRASIVNELERGLVAKEGSLLREGSGRCERAVVMYKLQIKRLPATRLRRSDNRTAAHCP